MITKYVDCSANSVHTPNPMPGTGRGGIMERVECNRQVI